MKLCEAVLPVVVLKRLDKKIKIKENLENDMSTWNFEKLWNIPGNTEDHKHVVSCVHVQKDLRRPYFHISDTPWGSVQAEHEGIKQIWKLAEHWCLSQHTPRASWQRVGDFLIQSIQENLRPIISWVRDYKPHMTKNTDFTELVLKSH